ncbi:MAG: SusC/RagA family TonB-linked outer membrane protein [Bacteroidales bacterium]
MRKFTLILLMSFALLSSAYAQKTITGKVIDDQGLGVAGASVVQKGTTKGTITDADGNYSLDVPEGISLQFSFMGMKTIEEIVDGRSIINVTMVSESLGIDEVVVTAMGIKRNARDLTYNTQKIEGSELTAVPEVSLVNSLVGKVAGVTINTSSSGIGGSSRVVFRGDKSINGNNNALYVLDGIPLPNLSSGVNSNEYGGGDGGDGIAMFNPEDIASTTVLTGATGAALYGSMAANGVVILNTKKGLKGKPEVNFSHSTQFYNPFVMPEFQNTYGTSVSGSFDSWGEKGTTATNYEPKDFFQTGFNITNSLSLAMGGEKNQTYVSVANSNAQGIIDNNEIKRSNIMLRNTSSLLDDKLTMDFTAMYANVDNQNMIAQGTYYNPIIPIYLFPRGDDISKYQVYERFNASRGFNTQFWPDSYMDLGLSVQNPYWTINRNLSTNEKNRYLLGATIDYDVLAWLNIQGRIKSDNTTIISEGRNYASTIGKLAAGSDNGSYNRYIKLYKQTYADLLATVNKGFGSFNLTSIVGSSFLKYSSGTSGVRGALSTANGFTAANLLPVNPEADQPDISVNQAIFATANLGYKNYVFLDLTARNEWPSQLAGAKQTSLFYPTVGLSAVISDMVSLPHNVISYIKVRGSYSEVGNSPSMYLTMPRNDYTPGGGISLNKTLPINLVPERTKGYEVGLNLAFLHNSLTLDATLYSTKTYNQIFTFDAPSGSSYSQFRINAGQVNNKGIEGRLGYNGRVGKVGWKSFATFTLNRNKVVELVDTENPLDGTRLVADNLTMANVGTSVRSVVRKGHSLGDIFVNSLATDSQGFIHIDYGSGQLQVDNTNLIYAGNSNPKYNIGFGNTFNYKNFNLSFLINMRVGGVGVSATQAIMDYYGVSQTSADARENGGVMVNGYLFPAQQYYQTVGAGTGVLADYTYSLTNIRLREASLGYTMPGDWFNNKIGGITLSLIGRNLFMFYNKAPFDPENTGSTGTYYQGVDFFMQPSLRNIGFSVKVKI